ncbi:PREDICTED: protein takeout-like [Drosophila arizonae]|uniref:Protein takeout-like n=1 Tax=Drosophila arizonae TaxID=7263 RepID=A0ABM1NNQ1_DROAR|nr:PREDICTED: protein takeout-like [Drosophila arizonae]
MDIFIVSLLIISSLNMYSCGSSSDLPGNITKCKIADEKCLLDGMNYVLNNFATTGIKELGLVKLDPLHIKKFSLAKNPNSPVSIDMTFSNAELIGLRSSQVKRTSTFTRELSRPIAFEMFSPKLTLKGPYSIDGKVLILPIVGKGDAEISLDNVKVSAIVKFVPVSKGPQQTYAKAIEVKIKLEPSRATYKLNNLFNGQKDLSDNLHVLINENWREVFSELQPDIFGAMGLIFKSVLNKALSKYPLEQLFSDP